MATTSNPAPGNSGAGNVVGGQARKIDPRHLKRLGGLFILIVAIMFIRAWSKSVSHTNPQVTAINYHKIIRDDAWQSDTQELPGDHFVVDMQEGSFGGLVYLPPGWNGWHYQPVGNDPTWWVAFWRNGDQEPLGPYDRNAKPNIFWRPMRFQGKGKILIYTTARQ